MSKYSTRAELSNFKNSIKSTRNRGLAIIDEPQVFHVRQPRAGRTGAPVLDVLCWRRQRADGHPCSVDPGLSRERVGGGGPARRPRVPRFSSAFYHDHFRTAVENRLKALAAYRFAPRKLLAAYCTGRARGWETARHKCRASLATRLQCLAWPGSKCPRKPGHGTAHVFPRRVETGMEPSISQALAGQQLAL
jgi:hypothetical protein